MPIGPLSSNIYVKIQGTDPLTLQIPVLGQIIGEVYAEPATVFWDGIEEGNSATKTVLLKANQGYLEIDRFNLSDSVKNILTIEVKKENVVPALIVNLNPQRLERGSQMPKKFKGFIQVFVKHDKENSYNEESNQKIMFENIDSSLEIKIPVLFFVLPQSYSTQ